MKQIKKTTKEADLNLKSLRTIIEKGNELIRENRFWKPYGLFNNKDIVVEFWGELKEELKC